MDRNHLPLEQGLSRWTIAGALLGLTLGLLLVAWSVGAFPAIEDPEAAYAVGVFR